MSETITGDTDNHDENDWQQSTKNIYRVQCAYSLVQKKKSMRLGQGHQTGSDTEVSEAQV